MPRAVVCGICGRAGSLVAEALAGAPDIELVGGVESPEHERVGTPLRDLWTSAGDGVVSGSLGSLRPGALDVLVDFSVPEQAVRCAEAATRTGAALVSATTGLSDSEAEAVRSAASSVPVVVAPNTSVGAGVFLALLERAASALGDEFDVELIEAHHRGKRDAPSGTALRATEVIAAARGEGLRRFALAEAYKPVQVMERILRRYPNFDVRRYNYSLKAWRSTTEKYVWRSDGRDEYYRVDEDPWNRSNLIESHERRARALQEMMLDFLLSLDRNEFGDLQSAWPGKAARPEIAAKLQALGLYRKVLDWPDWAPR